MKKTIAIAMLIALSSLAHGEHNVLTGAEKKEGWKLLFRWKIHIGLAQLED